MAVPTRGIIDWATVTQLEKIHALYDIQRPILWQPGNMSVALTRNQIVHQFINDTKCKYLFMVDDDVQPPTRAIETCLLLNKKKFGMVCTPHVLPTPDKKQLALGIYERDPNSTGFIVTPQLQDGLHECDGVATGCVAVSRKMLLEMGPDPFKMPTSIDQLYGTDDFYFCDDVKALGWKVGYFWNGQYCDHRARASLGMLIQGSIRVRAQSEFVE